MKTNTTAEQIKDIVTILEKLRVFPFREESCDPKYNAQRNLTGKTHYVDDDTLRFHRSRVLSARQLHGGLLFRIVCSDALDMHNTKRGFRAVVFDLFGNTVFRPKLEEAKSTSRAALNATELETINLLNHYREILASELKHRQEAADNFGQAIAAINSL